MQNKRIFRPEVETVWHVDYQTDYYQGVIVDQNDVVADRCRELRASYDLAMEDAEKKWSRSPAYSGKTAAEIKKEREASLTWDDVVGIWRPSRGKAELKILGIVAVVIAMWVLISITGGEFGWIAGAVFSLTAAIIGIIGTLRKQVLMFGTIIWDKHLYFAVLGNESVNVAGILQDVGFAGVGAALVMDENARNERYMDAITGIRDFLRVSGRKTLWKVKQIQEITKIKDGVWRVRMSYYIYGNINKCFQDRTRSISFKIHEKDYKQFNQLISCMEHIKQEA